MKPRQKHNAENERIKRRYFTYLKEAKRYSESSLDTVAKALARYEDYTSYREFRKFHIEQAVAFKRHLARQLNAKTGKPLSHATQYQTLSALRNFFCWLAGEPGYRSRLSYSDADYFSFSEKDARVAKATRERAGPSLEQVTHVLNRMPRQTAIEKRNRALIALTLLTGARDSALASLKLKHINLPEQKLVQDAREVNTKFSKTFTTWFFPVGDEVVAIVEDWVRFLREDLLWGDTDPLFPRTRMAIGPDNAFTADGLERAHWQTTAPIRRIFRETFEAAGLPYFNPHSFRKTLAQLGEQLCSTPEEFKAWSQNLGHEQVMTTLMSYGTVPKHRQAEIIAALAKPKPADNEKIRLIKSILDGAK
jgi:integrase/recombinase XerD